MAAQRNALVLGAGIMGLCTAWALARAGHRVSVYDPAPGPAPLWEGQGAAAFSAAGMSSRPQSG